MMLNMARRWTSERPSEVEAHVLAVDDSIIDRKVIERLLRTSSCKVTAVDSGMRALEFLGLSEAQRNSVVDELKIDLIITDYCMPGMTGYELLKRIKESSTFKETPVVIMSSENVITRIDRCLEEGAEDFILKPVKQSDVKRLKDYMAREGRSKGRESGINNKRKQRDGSDLSSESPPTSRSPPSDLFLSSSSSQSSSMTTPTQSPSSSIPSSPSGPLDSASSPFDPSEPLECDPPSEPLDSPSRRQKMDDEDDGSESDRTVQIE